jgi:Tfp pilus assembly protein PilN
MSRVNLLPSDIKKGQATRRRVALIILAGIIGVVLVLAFWVFQGMRLQNVKDDIQAQERTNSSLQNEVNDLQKFEDLRVEAQQQQELLDAAFANEVSYSGLLVDVSKVIPADTYLTDLTATIDPTAVPEAGSDTTFVGTITFSGETLHFESLSTWLTRLENVEGWANPWSSSITADAAVAGAFTFDTSVDLTQDALTQRGKAGQAVIGG